MFIITHKSAKQNCADTKEESYLTDVRNASVMCMCSETFVLRRRREHKSVLCSLKKANVDIQLKATFRKNQVSFFRTASRVLVLLAAVGVKFYNKALKLYFHIHKQTVMS